MFFTRIRINDWTFPLSPLCSLPPRLLISLPSFPSFLLLPWWVAKLTSGKGMSLPLSGWGEHKQSGQWFASSFISHSFWLLDGSCLLGSVKMLLFSLLTVDLHFSCLSLPDIDLSVPRIIKDKPKPMGILKRLVNKDKLFFPWVVVLPSMNKHTWTEYRSAPGYKKAIVVFEGTCERSCVHPWLTG